MPSKVKTAKKGTIPTEISVHTRTSLEASLCRDDFFEFVKRFWDTVPGALPLVQNWHIPYLCNEAQKIAERVFANKPAEYDFIVNISPGTSKSSIFSILYHPWIWTRMPRARILTYSNTSDLVLELASKAREVIRSDKYRSLFPEIQLSSDRDALGLYRNTLGGDRLACTVSGKSPMGFHAHFQIGDDPIDPKKAVSEAELKAARDFETGELISRVVDKNVSVHLLIMQRLHREDPTAFLLDVAKREGARPIRHICLPAEEADNIYPIELKTKYVDGLMDPVRLDRNALRRFRASQGIYGYSGQFMQSPVALGGSMFKAEWFNQRSKAAPYNCKRIRYWDRACLIGSTLVETKLGPKRISDVREGDLVLTRLGYRRVKWSGITKYVDSLVSVRFANGSVLTGTGDHPVWTENSEWRSLDTLDGDCYNLCLGGVKWVDPEAAEENTSNSMECATAGTKDTRTFGQTERTPLQKSPMPNRCIGRYGNPITATYPTDMTFITKMGMWIITQSKILNACLEKHTTNYMVCLEGGIRLKLGGSTKKNLMRLVERNWRTDPTKSMSVYHVVRNVFRDILIRQDSNFVVGDATIGTTWGLNRRSVLYVERSIGEKVEVGLAANNVPISIGNGYVLSVGKISKEDNSHNYVVPEVAELNGNGGIPVYDLEVEEAHEFFANGILVHNSTADGGAYTAGVLLAKDTEGNFYVEHVVHGQWEPYERNQKMRATALRDRAKYGPKYEPQIWIEREGGSSGRDAWKSVVRHLAGFKVREHQPRGSKDVRAEGWSSQLAALNVYLIDDGWDVQNYVEEHVLFRPDPGSRRLGKYKDQVDSSSAAFGLLTSAEDSTGLRVLPLLDKKKTPLRFVVVDKEQLESLVIEDKSLLISFQNPLPLNTSEDAQQEAPLHGLQNPLDNPLVLNFAPIDPASYQKSWNDPVVPYDRPPEYIIMRRDDGKRLWGYILRKRDEQPKVIVLQDDGDGRALSTAYALADMFRYMRGDTIWKVSSDDTWKAGEQDEPPIVHVYEMVKSTRIMIAF